MCQTDIISRRIIRLGHRSYDRHMRLSSPKFIEKQGELTRLLNDIDRLCEQLHHDFPTILEADYRVFGSELKLLINTLKGLRQSSLPLRQLSESNKRLRQQILDLTELDHDIQAFRVNALKNSALKETMQQVQSLDFSKILSV